MKKKQPKRGEIYLARLEWAHNTCVIRGNHPVLIISNNMGNSSSTLVNVFPITDAKKRDLPVHVDIEGYGLYKPSTIIVEQPLTLDKLFLMNKLGEVDDSKMQEIEKAISVQFDIKRIA